MLARVSLPHPGPALAGHQILPDPVARRRLRSRRGFTLVELLVVLVIIGLISGLAIATVLPAWCHREVSAAGRILQGAIVGAQSRASATHRPAGIRLLPDPAYPITWSSSGQIDPTAILAFNRAIPLESAPDYREGRCTPISPATIAYLGSLGAPFAPPSAGPGSTGQGLMVVEELVDPRTGAPNPPTSWFWNIRVGDRIQLNGSGAYYTVIGPTAIWPGNPNPSLRGNSELFVNAGPPGPIANAASMGYVPTIAGQPVEFLMLVNGIDDNKNGFPDEGFDGLDNNSNGLIDLADAAEWVYNTTTLTMPNGQPYTFVFGEQETWLGSIASHTQAGVPYAVRRRPAPSQNAGAVALPSSMVVDATTWLSTRERSRLPVNPLTGSVDVIVNPDGTILPTAVYSTPSSFGMDSAFLHFWLAERQDVAAAGAAGLPATAPYALPIASPGSAQNSVALPGPYLKGEYSVLSLSARTGNLSVSGSPPFLFDASIGYNAQLGAWNASNPFLPAEQGAASR